MPTETELKLRSDAAELEALAQHPSLRSAAAEEALSLYAVYFDTADRRLRRAGVSLRVRKEGERFIQTVKATQGAGAFKRSEWQEEVPDQWPRLQHLTGTPAGKLVRKKDALEPIFTVAVERRAFLVERGDSRIEIALDEGRIVSDESSASSETVREVELELKEGDASDLFELAKELWRPGSPRIEILSKSERGYALSEPADSGPAKGERVDLHDEMSAAEAFKAICHACIRHILLNENLLLQRPDPDVLHQVRVGVRRLRSAFSLFGRLLDDPQSDALRRELKERTEVLGQARNLDVFLASTLPEERRRRPDEAGLLNLEKTLEVERGKAYDAVVGLLRSEDWRRLVFDLVAWVETGSWLSPGSKSLRMQLEQPARAFAVAELEKRRRQVKKRGKRLDELTAEDRHRVRIAAKKLRYGSEFFASLFDGKKEAKRQATFMARLKELQELLGDLNDIATAYEVVTGPQLKGSALFAAGLAAGDIGGRSTALLGAARVAYEKLIDARPFWR